MDKLSQELLESIDKIKQKASKDSQHTTEDFEVLFLASLLEEEVASGN